MEEQFDLCDERGRLLGLTKARSEVHRDGDWHRSFHCWVFEPYGRDVRILLQLRPPNKDTAPDLWDVSVGGHYSAGEGIEGGIREMQEELGLRVSRDVLVQAGWRHSQVRTATVYDREVQDVFFLNQPIDLEQLRPDPEEVPSVALLTGAQILALAGPRSRTFEVPGGNTLPDRRIAPANLWISADRLGPRENSYYRRAVAFARRMARGETTGRRRVWW